MKKILTFIIACASLVTFSQAAVVDGTCGNNLTWTLNTQDSTLIIEGSGDMYNSRFQQSFWYSYNSYIKYIELPNGLTSIGNYAFQNCTALMSIIIPESVVNIGEYAFSGCSNITECNLPKGLTKISSYMFSYCHNLQSITIPNQVVYIEDHAFVVCSKLKTVTIGNKVTNIGLDAFKNCAVNSLTVFAAYPPNGGAGCGINAGICDLFVRESSLPLYQNTLWWEDFVSYHIITTLSYVVTFLDMDGTLLDVQYINEGEAAIAPANPNREGYTFIGWDKDFSNVTEDMVVTAQYQINRYRVQFLDWDNTLLKTDSVDWSMAATPPIDPVRTGYTFSNWDKDFTSIKSNLDIKAIYTINYYPVFFLDWDGYILSEQNIAYGSDANLPSEPLREGYTFVGWGSEALNIVERTFIIAQYEKKQVGAIPVTYEGMDGNVLLNSYVIDNAPEAPEIEGFTFLGWLPKAEFINDKIEIHAIYKSDSEAAPQVVANPSNPSQKLISNGNVYILTGDKTYTITGTKVK